MLNLRKREKLLHQLLWQSITEEHPQVAANADASIKDGWGLFGEDGTWNDDVPYGDKSNTAMNLVTLLTTIICGDCPTKNEMYTEEPVAKDEAVICTIENERIRSLYRLCFQVYTDSVKQLPPGLSDDTDKTLRGMTINDVRSMKVLLGLTLQLVKFCKDLFWCAVHDTVPAAANLQNLGLRKDWQLVKCAPSDEDSGAQLIMTPFGPAIQVSIDPVDLFKLFGGVGN